MGASRVKPGRVRLLPGALLSAPVFGISLLWAFLVQLGEWAGLGETVGTLGVRLASAFAVNVLMFAFPYLAWRAIGEPAPRARYYQLHQAFPHLPIAVLEVVIRDFEAMA